MNSALSIAVVGAGTIGRRHIALLSEEPQARLAAIVDPASAGRDEAERRGVSWFPTLDDLLAALTPDGIIIATPNALHAPAGGRAIAAGIPVLVEKPIADDVAAAEALVEAAEVRGVPLLVGHHRRHHPLARRARDIIASGDLGTLIAVHAFFWVMKPDSYFAPAWRREAGAGPQLVNLSHDIDMLRYLCGELSEIQALQSNAVRRHPVDETTVIIARFASGTLATLTISDTIVAPWSYEHTSGDDAVYPHTDQNCYIFGGTRASLSLPRCELWRHDAHPDWHQPFRMERHIAPYEDPLRRQIAHFCRVIKGTEPPLVSGRDGLRTLQTVEAVRRAAATGQCIRMDHT